MSGSEEGRLWESVTEMLGSGRKELGAHWSFNLINDPKRLGFVLSRYKFAGAPILAEGGARYLGVDLDEPAIEAARANFGREEVGFQAGDFLGRDLGSFDSVVSLDVIEHIHREHEGEFLETVRRNVAPDGICVIGTPNVTADTYASPMSKAGHVNLYDAERLTAAVGSAFRVVLSFGMNDETMHTGYAPMAHYLLAVGCGRR